MIEQKEQQLREHIFSPEQRHLLEASGYRMYRLTGYTIAELAKRGFPIECPWEFKTIPSTGTEVAIHPKHYSLPDSAGRTFDEQRRMLEEFDRSVRNRIPGIRAVLGSVADYAEVIAAHFYASKQRLFSYGKTLDYTWTSTRIADIYYWTDDNAEDVVVIGRFHKRHGNLYVTSFDQTGRFPFVSVAPLIVPEPAAPLFQNRSQLVC